MTVSPDTLPTITVEVDFNDGKGYQTVLSHTMTTPVPPTYKFGFAASTGAATDVHLIRNVAISTVTPLTQLNLVKQVDKTNPQPDSYKVGQTVPYQFLVTNSGAEPLRNVAVTDPNVSPITCPSTTLGAVGNPDASMVCTGTHVLTAADPGADGTFTNTATATATSLDGTGVISNQSSATVNVLVPQNLVITKTSNPATGPVKSGDVVTYTITVHNPGTTTYTNATFTDDLSGVLDLATLTGTPSATSGTITTGPSSLNWTGDVPVEAARSPSPTRSPSTSEGSDTMTEPSKQTSTPIQRRLRVAAIAVLALSGVGLAVTAVHAADEPQNRDPNGNLTNFVTSTSAGANCVTGAEPGCSTVLATPMFDPTVTVSTATAGLAGLGLIALRRQRTNQN